LANHLGKYEPALEPGNRAITGSITKATSIVKGDQFEATFAGIGK
jgi:2-keto-4-pentenoate hydratase